MQSHHTIKNPDEAFLRILCADMASPDSHVGGSKRRRTTKNKIEEIVSWIWSLGGLPGPIGLRERLSHQHALGSSSDSFKISANILGAIQTAIFDRRLFITDIGFMGIGPTRVQAGDKVYLHITRGIGPRGSFDSQSTRLGCLEKILL